MNHLRNNPFRNFNQQQLIDAALIVSIIAMTFAYKIMHHPQVLHY